MPCSLHRSSALPLSAERVSSCCHRCKFRRNFLQMLTNGVPGAFPPLKAIAPLRRLANKAAECGRFARMKCYFAAWAATRPCEIALGSHLEGSCEERRAVGAHHEWTRPTQVNEASLHCRQIGIPGVQSTWSSGGPVLAQLMSPSAVDSVVAFLQKRKRCWPRWREQKTSSRGRKCGRWPL